MPNPADPGGETPGKPSNEPGPPLSAPVSGRGVAPLIFAVVLILVIGGAVYWTKQHSAAQAKAAGPGRVAGMSNAPVAVVAGVVERKDVPIYLEGIGTVQAFNTVTIRSRVDGQVQKIAFIEGQEVHAGDLLAQIDPAPFQAQLDQNMAKKAQDEAQLAVAKITLGRDAELLASKILPQQDYDTQKSQVDQLEAAVKADQAMIDNARVQLAYTTITSPLEGRIGLRLVDQGNIVHANDPTGLVVITQLRPISVLFTLPQQDLKPIQQRLPTGEELETLALGDDNRTTIGAGKLSVIDNEIDATTGTIRLKSTFPNQDLKLWPGEFVNVRLLLETRKAAPVVPASVVQRGPDGAFAYVINSQMQAEVRPVTVDRIQDGQALIVAGLNPGERVVVDGQYKLQPGSKVRLGGPPEPGARAASDSVTSGAGAPTERPGAPGDAGPAARRAKSSQPESRTASSP